MSAAGERHAHLLAAANPRRATQDDARALARLFAAAFVNDPVFDWIARRGAKRAAGLERFFFWVLTVRAIPYGDVWIAADGSAAAAWLPPDTPASPGGFIEQMRLMPLFIRMCGIPRLLRASRMADAMEHHHPEARHYYLAFLATAPRLQGMGLGSAILEATLRRADAEGWVCYLENSNPKNTRLYERHGFVTGRNIAPRGAPTILPMWRDARRAG